ncbi:hypothetical protein EVAR_39031_1 [Eumeta japonica]|uniref:SWIM-type domain-containing protein n=1 Tax=Eumeta variegata TaxID=151549 RepID=A0A4C1WRX3_EUMVA|nr:hypothetical protein EVAR_39031_1 [Eumeta japonica]
MSANHICGLTVEANGYHGLNCQCSSGRFPCHHALNDIIRWALTTDNVPCMLEPPGLSRSDGKQTNELTLITWQKGYRLIWYAISINTSVASNLNNTSRAATSGAEAAAKQKHLKCGILKDTYLFIPVTCEIAEPWGSEAKSFIRELGRRLRDKGATPLWVSVVNPTCHHPTRQYC